MIFWFSTYPRVGICFLVSWRLFRTDPFPNRSSELKKTPKVRDFAAIDRAEASQEEWKRRPWLLCKECSKLRDWTRQFVLRGCPYWSVVCAGSSYWSISHLWVRWPTYSKLVRTPEEGKGKKTSGVTLAKSRFTDLPHSLRMTTKMFKVQIFGRFASQVRDSQGHRNKRTQLGDFCKFFDTTWTAQCHKSS